VHIWLVSLQVHRYLYSMHPGRNGCWNFI